MIPSEFETDKEVFDFIRSIDLSSTAAFRNIFNKYKFNYIEYPEFLKNYLYRENSIILDARSEREYLNTAIYDSINFPVLTNNERHNVGLVYSKYSNQAAYYMALEYVKPKIEILENFLTEISAKDKNIMIYCWRGGGRSKYLGKLLIDSGYTPKILTGGIKSFRKAVIDYFYNSPFPFKLIEISGLTGTGKTELLNLIKPYYPVIDLELCARHYSSLFGYIPFKIRNIEAIESQGSFENNIYNGIQQNVKYFNKIATFLIESESKKIGDFYIPQNLHNELVAAQTIKINCDIGYRVQRIVRDYFGSDNRGLEEVTKLFNTKSRYFRKELSNKLYYELMHKLESGDTEGFVETMLIEFYDKKYRDKGKKEIFNLNTNDINSASEELYRYLTENSL